MSAGSELAPAVSLSVDDAPTSVVGERVAVRDTDTLSPSLPVAVPLAVTCVTGTVSVSCSELLELIVNAVAGPVPPVASVVVVDAVSDAGERTVRWRMVRYRV